MNELVKRKPHGASSLKETIQHYSRAICPTDSLTVMPGQRHNY